MHQVDAAKLPQTAWIPCGRILGIVIKINDFSFLWIWIQITLGKLACCVLGAPVFFTESREDKTSFFQFFVSSFPVSMSGQECAYPAPASVMTWTQRQSLEKFAKRVMTTDLLFSLLVLHCYRSNITKQCYRSGASAFDQNPETLSCDKKLITKARLIVLWKWFDEQLLKFWTRVQLILF